MRYAKDGGGGGAAGGTLSVVGGGGGEEREEEEEEEDISSASVAMDRVRPGTVNACFPVRIQISNSRWGKAAPLARPARLPLCPHCRANCAQFQSSASPCRSLVVSQSLAVVLSQFVDVRSKG